MPPLSHSDLNKKKPQYASALCDSVVNRYDSFTIPEKKSQYHLHFIIDNRAKYDIVDTVRENDFFSLAETGSLY